MSPAKAPVETANVPAAITTEAKEQRMIVSPNRHRDESLDSAHAVRNGRIFYQARRSITAIAIGAGGANSRARFSGRSSPEPIVSSR